MSKGKNGRTSKPRRSSSRPGTTPLQISGVDDEPKKKKKKRAKRPAKVISKPKSAPKGTRAALNTRYHDDPRRWARDVAHMTDKAVDALIVWLAQPKKPTKAPKRPKKSSAKAPKRKGKAR